MSLNQIPLPPVPPVIPVGTTYTKEQWDRAWSYADVVLRIEQQVLLQAERVAIAEREAECHRLKALDIAERAEYNRLLERDLILREKELPPVPTPPPAPPPPTPWPF